MKRILLFIAFAINMTMTMLAQNSEIQLYVYAPEQVEDVHDDSMSYLVKNLCSAVTTEGIAAQDEFMTQFALTPKVSIVSKNIITNTQTQIVLNIDVSLQVIDEMSGSIYVSKTINLKGVGTNETKAYNSAFHSVNRNHKQITNLVNSATQKILA